MHECTCLLAVAHRTLGDAVRGMKIADSPSLPRKALASALDATYSFGVAVEVIGTREFENELHVSNPPNRCYFCKAELFTKMGCWPPNADSPHWHMVRTRVLCYPEPSARKLGGSCGRYRK